MIIGRPVYDMAQHGPVAGKMSRIPPWKPIRPKAELAKGYEDWLRRHGMIPVVKLSRWMPLGLRRSRLRALIEGRAHRFRSPTNWMPWEQFNELRAIEGKPLRVHTFNVSRVVLSK